MHSYWVTVMTYKRIPLRLCNLIRQLLHVLKRSWNLRPAYWETESPVVNAQCGFVGTRGFRVRGWDLRWDSSPIYCELRPKIWSQTSTCTPRSLIAGSHFWLSAWVFRPQIHFHFHVLTKSVSLQPKISIFFSSERPFTFPTHIGFPQLLARLHL